MNSRVAEQHVRFYRPDRPNDGRVEKAVQFAEEDPALRCLLEEQVKFDRQMFSVVRALQAPADLRKRLAAGCDDASKSGAGGQQFRKTAISAVVLGIVSTIGLLIFMHFDREEHFAGREVAEKMIAVANRMSGVELEPLTNSSAGQLTDWFYMRGFESYTVPPDLAALPVVGSRIFRQEGKPIAQLAVDRHQSILYIFRADDFRVQDSPADSWRIFEYEGWAAAFRRQGNTCTVLTFVGKAADMREFVGTLK